MLNRLSDGADALLRSMDAVVVPGGSVTGCRWKDRCHSLGEGTRVPFLGLCLGMQTAVIKWARNMAGLTEQALNSMPAPHPVIHLLPEQQDVVDLGGTMRLGVYPCESP